MFSYEVLYVNSKGNCLSFDTLAENGFDAIRLLCLVEKPSKIRIQNVIIHPLPEIKAKKPKPSK